LWLLSGLPVKGVMEKVADYVPRMGIVAENGCFMKTKASRASPTGEWISMVSNLNLTWKTSCVEILNYFTERTPGSFVEDRGASVVWRFWTGPTGPKSDTPDRQWARRQAAEAQNHIYDSLGERYGLRIIPRSNHVLVLPQNISRSTAVGAILHPGGPLNSPSPLGGGRAAWMFQEEEHTGTDLDFILVIGEDEKLHRQLNEIDEAETCSTSGKGTHAKWKLEASHAPGLLAHIASVS